MTFEVLLPEQLAEHAASGSLSAHFDDLDKADQENAGIALQAVLPDDGTEEQLQRANMRAMLEKHRARQTVAPIKLERPLAEPLAESQLTAARRVLHKSTLLPNWSTETDMPSDLLALLAGLVQTGVFGSIEVLETPEGVGSPDGVLFAGKDPNPRYCQGGSGKARFPIARWSSRERLSSFTKLCRRGMYSPDWIVPLVCIVAALCWTLMSLVHMFAAPDRMAWWAHSGMQLVGSNFGTSLSVLWLSGRLGSREKRGIRIPDWVNKLGAPAVTCFALGLIGALASAIVFATAASSR